MSAMKRFNSGIPKSLSVSLGLAALAMTGAPAAWASRTSIDFASAPGVFGVSTGLSMPLYTAGCASDALNGAVGTSCSLDLTGNGSAEIALGFDLTIGTTTYSNVFINENGFVTFGAAASSAAQNSGTFADLHTALGTTAFIAPAVADFTTGSSTPFDFFNDGTGIYYQRGLGVLGAGPYADNDPRAVDAFNVIWLTDVGSERFISQLLLYSQADGGFAAQFNYESAFGNPNPALPGGYGGYWLSDTTTASFGNNFNTELAPYLFAAGNGGGGGGGEDPPPVSVPEPNELALLAAGLVGLFLATRRRRRGGANLAYAVHA